MSDVEKLKASVLKNVNVPAVLDDMLDEVLKPALQGVVDSTSNPFDNMAMAAVYPELAAQLKKLSVEYWGKLLGPAQVQAVVDPGPGAPSA